MFIFFISMTVLMWDGNKMRLLQSLLHNPTRDARRDPALLSSVASAQCLTHTDHKHLCPSKSLGFGQEIPSHPNIPKYSLHNPQKLKNKI